MQQIALLCHKQASNQAPCVKIYPTLPPTQRRSMAMSQLCAVLTDRYHTYAEGWANICKQMSTLKWRWNQDHEQWGKYTLPSLYMSHFCMSCDPPTGIFCPGVKSWRRRCYLSWQLTAKLHIRASVVQVIQTLMKLCHSQIFHRGTAECFGDGGNYWVCFFRGWQEKLYWVQ